MKRFIATMAFAAVLLTAATGYAAEKTVTLSVENMFCPSCPYIVKKSLAAVNGVKDVTVSLENETAMVTFDDVKTNVEALTDATFDAGYPSDLKN
jgi:mercuric ion binding protein